MITREYLDKLIKQLERQGVYVEENVSTKFVRISMETKLYVKLSDKKLYRRMRKVHKVELAFLEMGYTINSKEYTRLLKEML